MGLSIPVPGIDGGPGENPAVHYYEHALELLEKLFEAEIDQSTYEEHLRYMGGIHVYPLFTIDKLISNLIKHVRRSLFFPLHLYTSVDRVLSCYFLRFTLSTAIRNAKIWSLCWKRIEQEILLLPDNKLPIVWKLRRLLGPMRVFTGWNGFVSHLSP